MLAGEGGIQSAQSSKGGALLCQDFNVSLILLKVPDEGGPVRPDPEQGILASLQDSAPVLSCMHGKTHNRPKSGLPVRVSAYPRDTCYYLYADHTSNPHWSAVTASCPRKPHPSASSNWSWSAAVAATHTHSPRLSPRPLPSPPPWSLPPTPFRNTWNRYIDSLSQTDLTDSAQHTASGSQFSHTATMQDFYESNACQ